MKNFDKLEKEDKVYILTQNLANRSTSLSIETVSIRMIDRQHPMNYAIFFKDVNKGFISVPTGQSRYKEIINSISIKISFSDIEDLDIFLKEEIEKQYKLINLYENLHELAWKGESQGTQLVTGEIYFYKLFNETCIMGKDGYAYSSDGFKITSKNLGDSIRDATPDEKIKFFNRLTRIIKARTDRETLIENIEKCGLRWNPIREEVIRI